MFWTLPGPSHFLQQALDSLAALKHVVVVVPDPVKQRGLLGALKTGWTRAVIYRRLNGRRFLQNGERCYTMSFEKTALDGKNFV